MNGYIEKGFNQEPEERVFPVAGVESPAILDFSEMGLLLFSLSFFFFFLMIELKLNPLLLITECGNDYVLSKKVSPLLGILGWLVFYVPTLLDLIPNILNWKYGSKQKMSIKASYFLGKYFLPYQTHPRYLYQFNEW